MEVFYLKISSHSFNRSLVIPIFASTQENARLFQKNVKTLQQVSKQVTFLKNKVNIYYEKVSFGLIIDNDDDDDDDFKNE